MLKKLSCILLCLLFSLFLPIAAAATGEETLPEEPQITKISIGTAGEFLDFAESCRLDSFSQNLAVTLKADLDLTDTDFSGVPIFCGSFDGGGHTITYSLDQEGSVMGLFRYLTDTALVENLNVSAQLHPGGSRGCVGGIAGENSGIIRGCGFSGTLQGSDSIGGIAGINTVSGIIDGCQSSGIIHGNHFVGGIAGQSQGVIRSCKNTATVNTTPQQNTVELSDITIESITASESSSTTTDIGGIAGISTGIIRRCVNRADIGYRQMGYNVGGIAGTQSGHIVDCTNYGSISGRKEVGGIAGQMEPAAKIEYSIDTLQILQQQLDTMSGLTATATANAQASASSIVGQLSGITDQVENARDAINNLVPSVDPENPDAPVVMPDLDSLLAAQSALSAAMSAMQNGLNGIASTAQGAAYTLSRDMKAVTNQMDAMGETIRGASEGLGGAITDVSDADTDADISGKIASSQNHGAVRADINAGGITGAMAFENDLDIQDDLDVLGEASLNFESELRAVILDCENTAQVSVNKQYGGGIVGSMLLGLVRSTTNTGAVLGENADYTGGIAGQSQGFIRSCNAKCEVSGSSFVGGIAGSASTVSDCRAANRLSGREKLGGILGSTDSRESITGNYYVTGDANPGAIDAISYDGTAQGLHAQEFLALKALPRLFRKVTVTFLLEDQSITCTVPLGEALADSQVPQLPAKEGFRATWEDIPAGPLLFDQTVTAVYSPYDTVIAFHSVQDETRPLLLAQGAFPPETALTLSQLSQPPVLGRGQRVLEGWQFSVSVPQAMVLRYQADDTSIQGCRLLVRSGSAWSDTGYTVDGSYMVFSVDAQADAFCLVTEAPNYLLYAAIALIPAAGIITVIAVIRKKHKRA